MMSQPVEDVSIDRTLITDEEVIALVKAKYGLTVTKISQMGGMDDTNYHIHVAETHENPLLSRVDPAGYTLKITNNQDTMSQHLMAEIDAIRYMTCVGYNIPSMLPMLNCKDHEIIDMPVPGQPRKTLRHMVRLMKYIPGIVMYDIFTTKIDFDKGIYYRVGRCASMVKAIMRTLPPLTPEQSKTRYNLETLPQKKELFKHVPDQYRGQMETICSKFEENVMTVLDRLPRGIIHGDIHYGNMVFRELDYSPEAFDPVHMNPEGRNDKYTVAGLLDFGDIGNSWYVFDLGVCCAHWMYPAMHFLKERLTDDEFRVLKYCIAARVTLLATICFTNKAETSRADEAEVYDFVLSTQLPLLPHVLRLLDTPDEQLHARWRHLIRTEGAGCRLPRTDLHLYNGPPEELLGHD